ncbi:MAG TPA: 7TM-DISM domain-containing protein, partial [Chitinophagaceae bacterium]|nr:7TM-DISM domain-containing protein [Chitinophagaceae bacterium]
MSAINYNLQWIPKQVPVEIPEFRFLKLLYVLIINAFCLSATGQVVEVSALDGVQHITDVQFMADQDGQLKLSEVEGAYKMGSFEKLSPDESGITGSVNVYWIAFSLKNSRVQPVQQLVEFYGWTKVNLYDTVSSDHKNGLVTGHLIPFKERNFPSADRCLIKLNI